MLIPVLFHSFTQASPSSIASLLLSAPSFIGDIYNTGVPEQFQTLFGPPPLLSYARTPPPHLAFHRVLSLSFSFFFSLTPISHPCISSLTDIPPHQPRTLSINLFIFRSKSVSLKSVTLFCTVHLTAVNFLSVRIHSLSFPIRTSAR